MNDESECGRCVFISARTIFITGQRVVCAMLILKSITCKACRDEPMVSLRTRLAAIPMNRLILFLDFDGTLTPMVPRPNRARRSRPVRETVGELGGLAPVAR